MFFGLPILPSNEVEDCFVEDVMSVAPTDSKCHQFSDSVFFSIDSDPYEIDSSQSWLTEIQHEENCAWQVQSQCGYAQEI
jgi:hypothetical protein